MKKVLLTLTVMMMALGQVMAMSYGTMRNHARFLSDRMAYELDLTPMQYDDCYEINYDFVVSAEALMEDVVYGYTDAISNYYRLLDYRNEDMMHILTAGQYARYMAAEYFFRPIYTVGRKWNFRIYTIYHNPSFFYFDAPSIYRSYRGAHSRAYYNGGYYHERPHVPHAQRYQGQMHIHGGHMEQQHGRNDFGVMRHDRNDRRNQHINDYNNRNQHNRTHDERYRDNSGNRHSPEINRRNQGSQSDHGSQSNHGSQGNHGSQSDHGSHGNQGQLRSGRR